MVKTLTATYENGDAARNARDDLIDTGYPDEKVFLDDAASAVKVITPAETAREAREILDRHQPERVDETPL